MSRVPSSSNSWNRVSDRDTSLLRVLPSSGNTPTCRRNRRHSATRTKTGFGSALYRAALLGRLGKDPAGAKFSAIAARLPAEDRRKLSDEIERLDIERATARRAA